MAGLDPEGDAEQTRAEAGATGRGGMAGTGVIAGRKPREIAITLGLVAVVAVSLVLLAGATGWRETLRSLGRISALEFAVLLALSLGNYGLRALRWHLYCRVLSIPVTFVQTLRHYVGGFAMTVTPGRVGELVRSRWLYQELGVKLERSAPLILVDRAADLAAVGVLIALSVALSATGLTGGIPVAVLSVVAAIVVTRAKLALWAVDTGWRLARRRAGRLFARLRRGARALVPFSDWSVVLPALALGMAGWFCEGLAFALLLDWMGAGVPMWTAIGIFLVAMVGGGATGSPGGLGGAEAAMVALLSLQGVPLEVSVPATAVIRLTTLWFAIALGVAVFPIATRMAQKAAAQKAA